MNVTEALALASDVLVIRVAELPQPVRDELGDDGAFAVTRARGRSPSILVDDATAQLLSEFRRPSTIVQAVIRLSRRLQEDPETVLSESYPTLRQFLTGGHLVAVDSEEAKPHQLALAVGERVAEGAVVRCVRVLADTEIYQLALDGGGLAALKVLRDGRSERAHAALRREADVLSLIDGRVSPRLLGEGEAKGHLWLCMHWCEGVPVATAAAGMRRRGEADAALLDLCRRVVDAYNGLHELGIVHGDVHPANILASPGGVRLVDFGLARIVGARRADDPPRGGAQAFFDPDYAAALRSRRATSPASFGSDQFSLGAVLYQLITGSNYLDFSIEKDEMLRQIVEDRPLPFTRRGRAPWPEMEAVLGTSLTKDAHHRFASTSELGRRMAAVTASRSTGPALPARMTAALDLALLDVVVNAALGGDWFASGIPSAPFCSVAYGAAGLAVALCRVAVLRSDPELVALADEWVVRAAREADQPGAFTSDELQLDEFRTGLVSPFHRRSGVHAVQALVSHAMGDTSARQQALTAFVAESRQPCDNLDLTLGRSGIMLTAALLLEAVDGATYADTDAVVDLGNETMAGLWDELAAMPPIPDGGPVAHLGVAHGWAGFLLATLRWCRIARAERPATLESRLHELASLARFEGLGARWAWTHRPGRPSATMPGWCNGSAGFVHLWATAYAVTGDDRWATLAERAAWDTYTSPTKTAQLCCGLAGQAYALLEMYRHSGAARWLAAASELGARAAAGFGEAASSGTLVRGSLHKGDVGIAVLAADLADPENAAMPFFGADI
jgi:serine/threonine-protein kinase